MSDISRIGGAIRQGKVLIPCKGSLYYGTKIHVDKWMYDERIRWIPDYSYIYEDELEYVVNLGAKVYEVLEL